LDFNFQNKKTKVKKKSEFKKKGQYFLNFLYQK